MGKTSVKNDKRIHKGKEKDSICRARKSTGLPCTSCVYDYVCNPQKEKPKIKVTDKPKKVEKVAKTIKKEEKRHQFTVTEKKEIMAADRQRITELAEQYGKPRNYILNLRARWKRQGQTIS